MKNLYVGNLSYSIDNQRLHDIFSLYGTVKSASVIMDRETGRSKGFGFVQMGSREALSAIGELHGKNIDGRVLTVNEAKPRPASNSGFSRMGRITAVPAAPR